jgi:hypothetical protein
VREDESTMEDENKNGYIKVKVPTHQRVEERVFEQVVFGEKKIGGLLAKEK